MSKIKNRIIIDLNFMLVKKGRVCSPTFLIFNYLTLMSSKSKIRTLFGGIEPAVCSP